MLTPSSIFISCSHGSQLRHGPLWALLLCLALLSSSLAMPVAATVRFAPETRLPHAAQWQVDADALCQVSFATQGYLAKGEAYDPLAIHAGSVFTGEDVTLQRVRQTLKFICQVAEEDRRNGQASRLQQAEFIQQHFELLRWHPDRIAAQRLATKESLLRHLPQEQLLITRYYLHKAQASSQQSADYPYALYGLPYDEQQLSLAEAEQAADRLTRYQFGKQQILEAGLGQLAPPLAWLKREDLEAALMQGTIVAQSDRGTQVFNVHRNNGIAYDRSIKPYQQQRYWYFKSVPQILGYGKDADFKIAVQPEVTVAGDLQQLGLGKLFLLRREEAGRPVYRMAVLADTGGAFTDNLFQLDWLSGAYQGRDAYRKANRHISDYAQVWLLLLKR